MRGEGGDREEEKLRQGLRDGDRESLRGVVQEA